MKKAFKLICPIFILFLTLALIREFILVNYVKEMYCQELKNEADHAYFYALVLNDPKLGSNDKLLKLHVVSEAEIPPVVAQLDTMFSFFAKKVPNVRNQLVQFEKVDNGTPTIKAP